MSSTTPNAKIVAPSAGAAEARKPKLSVGGLSVRALAGRADAAPLCAAALALAAALIHLRAVPVHAFAWWAYGAFFVTVALAQGLFAAAVVLRPGRWVCLAGIAGNLSVVAMYVLSRTSGVSFGPHAGRPEEVGALDMAATAFEVGIVVLLAGMLEGPYRRLVVNGLLVLGLAVWSLRLAGVIA